MAESKPPINVTSIKPFVPSKDFETSKQFYQDLGMALDWEQEDICQLTIGATSILLQNFYQKEWAENFMLQLNVKDLAPMWQHIQSTQLQARYPGIKVLPPKTEAWGDVIYLIGPAGELWHITEPKQ